MYIKLIQSVLFSTVYESRNFRWILCHIQLSLRFTSYVSSPLLLLLWLLLSSFLSDIIYIIALELFSCFISFSEIIVAGKKNVDERNCMEADVERISKHIVQAIEYFSFFFLFFLTKTKQSSNIQKYNVKD